MGSGRQNRVKDDPEGFGPGNRKDEIKRDGEKSRFGGRSLVGLRTYRCQS